MLHSARSALTGFSARPLTVMLCLPLPIWRTCKPMISAADDMPTANNSPRMTRAREIPLSMLLSFLMTGES